MSISVQEAAYILGQKFILNEGISGISYRESEPRIVVYVESDEDAEKVPDRLLGYRTEVVVIGRLYTLQANRQRLRPVPAGASIGCRKATGTLTTFAFDIDTGARILISCRHVLQGSMREAVIQPGAVDGGKEPDDIIGYVYRHAPIKPPPEANLVDASAAAVFTDVETSNEVIGIGYAKCCKDVSENMEIAKSGRTTGVTKSVVIDTNATVKVYGYDFLGFEYAIFRNQILAKAFSNPGDSGSPVISSDEYLVGMVFAGSDSVTAINRIDYVMKELKASPEPVAAPAPAAVSAMALLALALTPVAFPIGIIASEEMRKIG